MKVKSFFKDFFSGAAIGVAMIIPGVSGGTIAVLLNIYDKLIGAFGDLRKNFKANIMFLLPLLLGVVIAFLAMRIPLKFALDIAPFPTVMLFAGLMIGSMPKLFKDSKSYGFKKINIFSALLPALVLIAICVVNIYFSVGEADLSRSMPVWGYFAIVGVAMLGSCALVIPGVSGSMLLMILGYFHPIINLLGTVFSDFGHAALVLGLFAVGIIIGFFSIARLMKIFLNKFPRGTHWAIIGFVLASIPALFIVQDYSTFPMNGVQVAAGMVLCALGVLATYMLTSYAESKSNKQ